MNARQPSRIRLAKAAGGLCALLVFTNHAMGGDFDIHYTARLSKGDHYNSKGERLTTVANILRQDRANYHKGAGDADDGDDQGYFSTSETRSKFNNYRIVLEGISADEIIKGTPDVIVEVYEDTIFVFSE